MVAMDYTMTSKLPRSSPSWRAHTEAVSQTSLHRAFPSLSLSSEEATSTISAQFWQGYPLAERARMAGSVGDTTSDREAILEFYCHILKQFSNNCTIPLEFAGLGGEGVVVEMECLVTWEAP